MSLLSIKWLLFFFSLCAAALFAFLEMAFSAVRLFTLKDFASRSGSSSYKKLLEAWESNPSHVLIPILIASNLADVACSVLIADITHSFLGDTGIALAVGVLFATLCILCFGEIIPKSLAKIHHERFFSIYIWLINLLFYVFYPVTRFLLTWTNVVVSGFKNGSLLPTQRADISENEIQFLIDYGDKKGVIKSDTSEMLQNIFLLGQTVAKEILVPATEMIMLNVDASLEAALERFSTSRFSRLPVYEGGEDNIIGMIYQKDLLTVLCKKEQKTLRNLVMPILFEPDTKKINQLLSEFLKQQIHMAIVIDEFGKVCGLITLEDILEEIVGDILDEREQVAQDIIWLEQGKWMVDGRIELDKLEPVFGISFKPSNAITLSGFLTEHLQHLPKKGELFVYKNYRFHVQRTTSRRVQQVLVFTNNSSAVKNS